MLVILFEQSFTLGHVGVFFLFSFLSFSYLLVREILFLGVQIYFASCAFTFLSLKVGLFAVLGRAVAVARTQRHLFAPCGQPYLLLLCLCSVSHDACTEGGHWSAAVALKKGRGLCGRRLRAMSGTQGIGVNKMKTATEVDCHFLLLGIFLTLGLNPGLSHCRRSPALHEFLPDWTTRGARLLRLVWQK